jgi:hypothetical protein
LIASGLTRIFHQQTTASADKSVSTVSRSKKVLNLLSSMPAALFVHAFFCSRLLHRLVGEKKGLRHVFVLFFIGLGFMVFEGCYPTTSPRAICHFDNNSFDQILLKIKEQRRFVKSFVCSGRVKIKTDDSEIAANILIAGDRDPIRIKIEATHRWGRPLCHILIQNGIVQILSFPEKKYHVQPLGKVDRSGLFPSSLAMEQVWGVLRGYPVLRKHDNAGLINNNQIALFDRPGEDIQILEFCSDHYFPCKVTFSDNGLKISRFDFEYKQKILFARKTILAYPMGKLVWEIKLKQMVFNTDIPENLFKLDVPPDYQRTS